MTHPSGQRRPDGVLVFFCDEEKSRRSRPTVQVLVAAANGEIDLVMVEVDGHGAGTMTQVPEHQGAAFMGGAGQLPHVMQLSATEVGVGCGHNRDLFVDGSGDLGVANQA